MNQLSFVDAYRTFPYILTEGAIVERLRHEFHIPLDEHLVHAALIYDDAHRDTNKANTELFQHPPFTSR